MSKETLCPNSRGSAETYFDEAADSIMQRVHETTGSTYAPSSRGDNATRRTATSSAAQLRVGARRGEQGQAEVHVSEVDRYGPESCSKDLTGWLSTMGMQHLTTLFEDIGVAEVRDFWLVEQSDLQEAGFTAEQIALFSENLRKLDGSSGSINAAVAGTGPVVASPTADAAATTRRTVTGKAPSDSVVPTRLLQNLQAYFPKLEVVELERALRNMDFHFGKTVSLLTELYPQHRVMEPTIADNILNENSAANEAGGGASHKVGKFPVPPAAMENLSRQFPGIPLDEVEQALRQNRLNFVKSVKWLQMRHPDAVAAGTGPRGAKSLRRQNGTSDTVHAIGPFVDRLVRQFPNASRHHVEEALQMTGNKFSKAQLMLSRIYMDRSGTQKAAATNVGVESAVGDAGAASAVDGTQSTSPTTSKSPDAFDKMTSVFMPTLAALEQSFRPSTELVVKWLGDIDPSLATFGQKFVEFGVEDREDLALVEKKDLQSFGLSEKQIDAFLKAVAHMPTVAEESAPLAAATTLAPHGKEAIGCNTACGGVNPGDVKSSNTDPGASADPCLDEPNRPAKAQAATSHTSNAAKTLGLTKLEMEKRYPLPRKDFTLDDYYSLLNDLAPPGKEDGATFFDFVAPRLATPYRKQVADVIQSFLSELWDEFDHSNTGSLSLSELRKLCKYFLQHLRWMLEKKECWDGGLTRQHLLKTMSGIFKKRDKSQAKGVRLDADIVTGKRLARKIVQVSGVMRNPNGGDRNVVSRAQFEAYFQLSFKEKNDMLTNSGEASNAVEPSSVADPDGGPVLMQRDMVDADFANW